VGIGVDHQVSRGGAGIRHRDVEPAGGAVGIGVGVGLIRERPGWLGAGLLQCEVLWRGHDRRDASRTNYCGYRRQGRITGVGTREIESGGQVAADVSAPGTEVRLFYSRPGLEEANDRGVVEYLRTDVAAAGPGRDQHHGDANAQPDGQAADELAGGPRRRHRRRDMVEETAVLVIGEHEDRRVVHRRV